MKKLLIAFLIISLSTFLLTSCSRVQEPTKGELKKVILEKLDAIPIEYGSLVGVIANPESLRWAQLWFEDDDGIIRVVSAGQSIHENVTVIPRN